MKFDRLIWALFFVPSIFVAVQVIIVLFSNLIFVQDARKLPSRRWTSWPLSLANNKFKSSDDCVFVTPSALLHIAVRTVPFRLMLQLDRSKSLMLLKRKYVPVCYKIEKTTFFIAIYALILEKTKHNKCAHQMKINASKSMTGNVILWTNKHHFLEYFIPWDRLKEEWG